MAPWSARCFLDDAMATNFELDPVLREEAAFADRDYAPFADQLEINSTMFERYAAPTDVSDWRQMAALLLGDLRDQELLDFGCGMGEESVYFAKLGAKVTGIDISEVGTATLRRRAEHHGLDIRAFTMRADPTELDDDAFDRVHGLGILHHIGIESGLAEVHRLLRPGGIAVFLEPLGDSIAVETVKTWLMRHVRFLGHFDDVTEHERNLTWRELDAVRAGFHSAWLYPYHLLYRLKRVFPTAALSAIRRLDHAALSLVPALKKYAGGVVIRLQK
jgi:SAM-dependent methyltransferase